MNVKVRRGLGLLVVATMLLLLGFVLEEIPMEGVVLRASVTIAYGVAMLGTVIGGLGLLAWGLLRD